MVLSFNSTSRVSVNEIKDLFAQHRDNSINTTFSKRVRLAVLILSLYYQKKSDFIFSVSDKSQAAAV